MTRFDSSATLAKTAQATPTPQPFSSLALPAAPAWQGMLARAPKPAQLWYSRQADATPLGLAAQLGWLEQEFTADAISVCGLRPNCWPDGTPVQPQAATYGIFRQESCYASLRYQAIVGDSLLIGLHWRPQRALLWVRADSPLQHWSELNHVKIGLPALHGVDIEFRAQQWRLWQLFWQHQGVDVTALHWVDIDIDEAQSAGTNPALSPQQRCNDALQLALQQGRVDVVLLHGVIQPEIEPSAQIRLFYDLQQLGDAQIDAALTLPMPLTVDRQLWRSHPDLVLRFLQRVLAVEDWAARHPHATYDYIAQSVGMTAAEVPRRFGADIHLRQGTHLAFHMLNALDNYQQFLCKQALLPSAVSLADWIEPLPLQILQARHAAARALQHGSKMTDERLNLFSQDLNNSSTLSGSHPELSKGNYPPTLAEAVASLW